VFLWSSPWEAIDSALIKMASTVFAAGKALLFYFKAAFFRRGRRADFQERTMGQFTLESPAFLIYFNCATRRGNYLQRAGEKDCGFPGLGIQIL
jgi:hypothetical protein